MTAGPAALRVSPGSPMSCKDQPISLAFYGKSPQKKQLRKMTGWLLMTDAAAQKRQKPELISGLAARHASHRSRFQRMHRDLVSEGLVQPRSPGRGARPLAARDGLMLQLAYELSERSDAFAPILRAAWALPPSRRAPDLPAGEIPVVVAGDGDAALAAQVAREAVGELEAALGIGTAEPFGAALESLAGPVASRLVDRRAEALAGACGRLDATVRVFGPDPLSGEIEIIAEIDPPGGPYVSARRVLEYGTSESPVISKLIALRDDPDATPEERAEARRALARRVRDSRPRALASVGLDDILTIARLIEGGARRNGG